MQNFSTNMKNKLLTLTIGICAYNEENNIVSLLESIIKQNREQFGLNKIVVVSDGSTDDTNKKVKQFSSKHNEVILLNDGQRKGKPARLNYLFKTVKSDILVCFDADVILRNNNVLNEIAHEFANDTKLFLLGGNDIPNKQKTFFGKINVAWINYWQYTRRPVNNYINPTNNPGRIYALRKEFANKITIPENIAADDHFVFYEAMKNKFKFAFCKNAVVNFKPTTNLSDFLRQSDRFGKTGYDIKKHFKFSMKKYQYIPRKILIKQTLFFALKNPVYFPLAICMQIGVGIYMKSNNTNYSKSVYNTLLSSK